MIRHVTVSLTGGHMKNRIGTLLTIISLAVGAPATSHAQFAVGPEESKVTGDTAIIFSGGGIRATIGALTATEYLEANAALVDPAKIKYVGGLSGGAWGVVSLANAGGNARFAYGTLGNYCKFYNGWGHAGFTTLGQLRSASPSSWSTGVQAAILDPSIGWPLADKLKYDEADLKLHYQNLERMREISRLKWALDKLEEETPTPSDYLARKDRMTKELDDLMKLVPTWQAEKDLVQLDYYLSRAKMPWGSPNKSVITVVSMAHKDANKMWHWCDYAAGGLNCPSLTNAPVPVNDVKVDWGLSKQVWGFIGSLATVQQGYPLTLPNLLAITGGAAYSGAAEWVANEAWNIAQPLSTFIVQPSLFFKAKGNSPESFVMYDAGVHINLPFPSMLINTRGVKKIVAFDFSFPGKNKDTKEPGTLQLEEREMIKRLNQWCSTANPTNYACSSTDPFKAIGVYQIKRDGSSDVIPLQIYSNKSVSILIVPLAGREMGNDLVHMYNTFTQLTYGCAELRFLHSDFLQMLERGEVAKVVQAFMTDPSSVKPLAPLSLD